MVKRGVARVPFSSEKKSTIMMKAKRNAESSKNKNEEKLSGKERVSNFASDEIHYHRILSHYLIF